MYVVLLDAPLPPPFPLTCLQSLDGTKHSDCVMGRVIQLGTSPPGVDLGWALLP